MGTNRALRVFLVSQARARIEQEWVETLFHVPRECPLLALVAHWHTWLWTRRVLVRAGACARTIKGHYLASCDPSHGGQTQMRRLT
jgi:hypothetical protein